MQKSSGARPLTKNSRITSYNVCYTKLLRLLLNLGYTISGSDLKLSHITDRLKEKGAVIYKGHAKENIKDVNVVVTSSAISSQIV